MPVCNARFSLTARNLTVSMFMVTAVFSGQAAAKQEMAHVKEDKTHITTWNAFADKLYQLHTQLIAGRDIRTEEKVGGYGGVARSYPDFYREVKYYHRASGRLLSTIQWELENPEQIHTIEVFIHDQHGRVVRDYLAAFLPHFRNAPIQTLINFHNQDDELRAFRQFDASGARIYERCDGRLFDQHVQISLEDYELAAQGSYRPRVMDSEAYLNCFGELPVEAGDYLDPLADAPTLREPDPTTRAALPENPDSVETAVATYGAALERNPNDADTLVKRGHALFLLRDFHGAVADLDRAIALNAKLDDAWFWRGMARGRMGQIAGGIADLTVFIDRNPRSSLAFTKRGVRHLWQGEREAAESDLRKAIELDPLNAEAHDDLGVVLAQRGDLPEAIEHFSATIRYDPNYQKAYHNLATVYFLTEQMEPALRMVDMSLSLSPDARDSRILKSEILHKLGRFEEATELRADAEFLPEGNWSERLAAP